MLNTANTTQPTTPLIKPTPPTGEESHVAKLLEQMESHLGFIPDGLRLYGISPPLLEAFIANVGYFAMGGTRLAPELTTMIRYLVSSAADCHFCIDMNEGFLINMGFDLDEVRKARNNPDLAPLPDEQTALLKMALRSVSAGETVNQSDIDHLYQLGWSDRDIFDAVAQAASNRAFNHVLRTFNVEHQGAFT